MNTQPDQEDVATSLTSGENKAVAERRSGSAKVVHEVIRI